MKEQFNRRDFINLSGLTAATTAAASLLKSRPVQAAPFPLLTYKIKPIKTVRVGFVGTGHQGSGHVRNLLQIEGVEVRAICDIVEKKVSKMQQVAVKAGKKKPDGYSKGPEDYKRLCDRKDLDLVYTATPWNLHVPVMMAAMKAGKHAATEVPAAVTVEDCWKLVETSEKLKRHCIMMENCCYDRAELMILNMVRKGILGELIHAECGYLHDLRGFKFNPKYYHDQWRL